MSKRPLRARAGRPIVTRPSKSIAAPPTAASLTRLLSRPDRGPVILESGSVRPSLQTYSAPLSWGWGYAFDFPAPPVGHVLWYQFSVDWCLWEWREFGPANNTSTSMRIDFGVSWAWELVANPYYFTDPLPRFVDGSDRYEFSTSISPGSAGWSAGWIAPTRTVTLTPDSKESDPTPLALLLGTKVDGSLRLWYRGRATEFVVNGRSVPGGGIYGAAPDTIHWAWAVELPRVSDATAAVQPPLALR
jgi:hypothetical protein